MTDRELLELAAKAAGIKILRFGESEDYYEPCRGYVAFIEWLWSGDDPMDIPMEAEWNPLDDDGDALRLAVKLRLDVTFGFDDEENVVSVNANWDGAPAEVIQEIIGQDVSKATRRAIVRAAAEIGMGV